MNAQTRKILSFPCILLCLSLALPPVYAQENEPDAAPEVMEENASVREEQDPITEQRPEEPEPAEEEIPEEPEGEREDSGVEEEPGHPETQPEEALSSQPNSEKQTESSSLFVVPEGFSITEQDREAKARLREKGLPSLLETLRPGIDYEEQELLVYAEEEEQADAVAEIFHGSPVAYACGIATIRIEDENITVKDAVLASLTQEELPFAEPNYITSLEPSYREDRVSEAEGQSLPEVREYSDWVREVFRHPDPALTDPSLEEYCWYLDQVGVYPAWNATMGSPEVTVAVIDSSVNASHEELMGRVTSYDIGKGTYYGAYGHGTAMAGVIAAAADNGKGGAGIAPDVKILSMNIFYYDSEYEADTYNNGDLIAAIDAAIKNGAWIINMSLGGWEYSDTVNHAVNTAYDKGVTLVASAGNTGSNMIHYPAGYDKVISVASVNRTGARDAFSCYGNMVTIAAPGSGIYVPVTTSEHPSDSDYDLVDGTSPAAAVVSGVLALYMSRYGKISPQKSFELLKTCALPSSSEGMGSGIISASRMFEGVQELPVIAVYDKSGNRIRDLSVPVKEGSYALIELPSAGDDIILYTTDGKTPAVKDGEIATGNIYSPKTRIELDAFERNKTVKITASAVNSLSVAGKAVTLSIKTPVPQAQQIKIKTVKLEESKASLSVSSARGIFTSAELHVKQLTNTEKRDVPLSSVDHQWFSSDPSVAKVDETGKVTAVSPGSAKITLKILDGSNKTAACTVTVNQLAEQLEISGQNSIAPGSSASYKAVFTPEITKNKSVEWSLKGSAAGVEIDKKGKVKVSSAVRSGTSFQIAAKALDESGITAEKTIVVGPKAGSIVMTTADPRAVRNKSGVLQSAVIFTEDLKDAMHPLEDQVIQLNASVIGSSSKPLWKSSNPKVAVVDDNGRVTAAGEGTAKITAETTDGSKKKASMNLTVRVPVSSLSFHPGLSDGLGIGKSVNLSQYLAFGDTYGKPTTTKANWTITYVMLDDRDVTEQVLSKKLIALKNGKLTASSSLSKNYDFSYSLMFVGVRAESADGTGYAAEQEIAVFPAAKTVQVFDGNGSSSVYAYNDAPISFWVFCDSVSPLEVISSNPEIAGVSVDNSRAPDIKSFPETGKLLYGYWSFVTLFPNRKTGEVTITAKTLDGSKKTGKMKVNIIKRQ